MQWIIRRVPRRTSHASWRTCTHTQTRTNKCAVSFVGASPSAPITPYQRGSLTDFALRDYQQVIIASLRKPLHCSIKFTHGHEYWRTQHRTRTHTSSANCRACSRSWSCSCSLPAQRHCPANGRNHNPLEPPHRSSSPRTRGVKSCKNWGMGAWYECPGWTRQGGVFANYVWAYFVFNQSTLWEALGLCVCQAHTVTTGVAHSPHTNPHTNTIFPGT